MLWFVLLGLAVLGGLAMSHQMKMTDEVSAQHQLIREYLA